ncbi:MAG: SIR2 family protein [Leptospirales bacterium]
MNASKTWCEKDGHNIYDYYLDFNQWLESDEGANIRIEAGLDGLAQASKVFYVSDRLAYVQAYQEYRIEQRHKTLNESFFNIKFSDEHWFSRNLSRFDQLLEKIDSGTVIPFVGAGISQDADFPTWQEHLKQQGRTAGLDPKHVEALLESGKYEEVVEEIENTRGRNVFTQEIIDVFSVSGALIKAKANWLIAELFTDTVITTNYDRVIEQTFETGKDKPYQVINGLNAMEKLASDRVTIIKLHGGVSEPEKCIFSKKQYDHAYGMGIVDLKLPIPKLLDYYYKNSSLLFLGCGLNNDRTVQVFRSIQEDIGDVGRLNHFAIEQAPENEKKLVERNEYLVKLGITGIWFEKNRFEYVERMLNLAKSELKYRKASELLV